MFNLVSSLSIAESRNLSDKHIMSYWLEVAKAFSSFTFEKLCAVILFKFQWQKEIDTVFLGPGFDSISSLRNNSKKISYFMHFWE